jgi:hypothetical protein
MVEPDFEQLVSALRRLAPSIRESEDRAWSREPALRVLDCVLSLNRNYDRFVVPRLDFFEHTFPQVCSVGELSAEIKKHPSPHEFVRRSLNYNHEDRAATLAGVVGRLVTICGEGARVAQLTNLEKWAGGAPCDGYRTFGVRGFGLAGYQYLRMLFGANTTKPDIRICQLVAEAIGRPLSPMETLRLLERAAAETNVRLRDVDTTIWEMLARGESPLRPKKSC